MTEKEYIWSMVNLHNNGTSLKVYFPEFKLVKYLKQKLNMEEHTSYYLTSQKVLTSTKKQV